MDKKLNPIKTNSSHIKFMVIFFAFVAFFGSLLLGGMAAGLRSSLSDSQNDASGLLYSFAVLTDIQYANVSDGSSVRGTPRYYRHERCARRCAHMLLVLRLD